jgi:hypothetical protein
MQLDDYVTQVQAQLTATAALADERTQQVAEALVAASAPAVRLAIMSAISQAADELTAALLDAPGAPTVTVRLDGGEVRVDVSTAEPEPNAPRADEGDATARISLRLSDALKADVEAAATAGGVSVNTWLIRAAAAALAGNRGPSWSPHSGGRAGHRITGWINS